MRFPTAPLLPLWLKLAYTTFVVVLVPVYWVYYGPQNFLWGSDIALLVMVVGLWWEQRLLASMMSIAVLLPELLWNMDFFLRLIAGHDVFGAGLTTYMFNPARPLPVRTLSLFHVFLPVLLLYTVWRLGYDRRAYFAQCLLTWVILPVSFLFTDPARNINGVFGFGEIQQTWMPPWVYLVLLMGAYPMLVYWPTHILLKYYFLKN